MASPKRPLDIDPDYEIITYPAAKRKKVNENADAIKIETVTQIIQNEFKVELDLRQKELELIQQRLTKAKKILHLVKYLAVTSFYNNKLLNVPAEEVVIDDSGNKLVPENRIHPAVKGLIGKRPSRHNYSLESRSSKRVAAKTAEKIENNVTKESDEDSMRNIIEFKSNPNIVEKEKTEKHVKIITSLSKTDGRGRKKQNFRVVIGNISKYMPADSSEDESTHKWMVYVRGPKDNPDISHFIKKVRFFLHPSYKPHHIVEVREHPFHLSRRGWGEFPLRVQLYFMCGDNKPVDVIHNIKLDKTYTGRQTLGNETIYDLQLYTDVVSNIADVSPEPLPGVESNSNSVNEIISVPFESMVIKQECVEFEENYIGNQESDLENTMTDIFPAKEFDNNAEEFTDTPEIKIEPNIKEEPDDTIEEIVEVASEFDNIPIKYENFDLPSCSKYIEPLNYNFVDIDHDYCSIGKVKSEVQSDEEDYTNYHLNFEHSYSSNSTSTHNYDYNNSNEEQEINEELTSGIKIEEEIINDSIVEEAVLDNFLPLPPPLVSPPKMLQSKMHSILKQNNNQQNYVIQKFVTPDGKIILVKKPRKPHVSLLKKIFQKKIVQNGTLVQTANQIDTVISPEINQPSHQLSEISQEEKYKVTVPDIRMFHTDNAILYLLKHLPLISELANNKVYKCLYPFTAPSEEIFKSWHIGKRLSAEWSRAKEIKNLLISHNLCDENSITTKYIINYARLHYFTPFLDEIFSKKKKSENAEGISQNQYEDYADALFVKSNLLLGRIKHIRTNKFVDIIDIDDSIQEVQTTFDVDGQINPEHQFIRKTAAEIGIDLKHPENKKNVLEKVLLKATLCFAENLIRNAYASKISSNNYKERDGIVLDLSDVYKGLLSKKFKMFFKPNCEHPLLK